MFYPVNFGFDIVKGRENALESPRMMHNINKYMSTVRGYSSH